jgi:hypothetical protein
MFPFCKEFENKKCLKAFQDKENAMCFDQSSDQFIRLSCKEVSRKVMQTTPNGKGSQRVTLMSQEWVRSNPDLYMESREAGIYEISLIGFEGRDDYTYNVDLEDKKNIKSMTKFITRKWKEKEKDKPMPKIIARKVPYQFEQQTVVKDRNNSIGATWFYGDDSQEKAENFIKKVQEDIKSYLIETAK